MQLPLFEPVSKWTPPTRFPDLSYAKEIGIDLETKDPLLVEMGPGIFRRDGEIVGVSITADSDFTGYYPVHHFGGGNLDKDVVFRWLKDQLKGNQPKVGANLFYDVSWLRASGVVVGGPLYDVQIAEPILDEEAKSYRLGVLCEKYGIEGKEEDLLNEAAKCFNIDAKRDLWKLPAKYVGPYAERDSRAPIEIFKKQKALLEAEGLWEIFELERRILPIVIEMYFKGFRVDLNKAEKVSKDWKVEEERCQASVSSLAGFSIDAWSGQDIAKACEKLSIVYPKTEIGNPSFTKEWMLRSNSPFIKELAELRKYQKLRRDFIDGFFLKHVTSDGRIHATPHQLRRDEEGTRSGRFSYTDPNPQQLPARDSILAPIVRSIVIPEDGCKWAKLDYSQQEPRILVHYAALRKLERAEDFMRKYQQDRNTDFYQIIMDEGELNRKDAKDATLGRFYEMGVDKYARKYNKEVSEAKRVLAQFDLAAPFVRPLSRECMRAANSRGYIKTLLGRKRHFNLWEPSVDYDTKMRYPELSGAFPLDVAKNKWPRYNLRRAFTYRALNALVQGSAADMTKQSMLLISQAGIIPHLQVHDELDFSVESEAQAESLKTIMENAIPLSVPMKVDLHVANNWGEAK